MRCDGGRLRDDVQRGGAEHLVHPAGDRLLGGRHQAEQYIADPIGERPGLAGPRQVEGTGAVVQQGRGGQPQRGGDALLAFVPGRADRVEAGAARAQPPGGQVDMTAGELGVEQLQAVGRIERIAGERGAGVVAGGGRKADVRGGGGMRPRAEREALRRCSRALVAAAVAAGGRFGGGAHCPDCREEVLLGRILAGLRPIPGLLTGRGGAHASKVTGRRAVGSCSASRGNSGTGEAKRRCACVSTIAPWPLTATPLTSGDGRNGPGGRDSLAGGRGRGYALRATPHQAVTSAAPTGPAGRHSCGWTTPGSTSSRPSKKRVIAPRSRIVPRAELSRALTRLVISAMAAGLMSSAGCEITR